MTRDYILPRGEYGKELYVFYKGVYDKGVRQSKLSHLTSRTLITPSSWWSLAGGS